MAEELKCQNCGDPTTFSNARDAERTRFRWCKACMKAWRARADRYEMTGYDPWAWKPGEKPFDKSIPKDVATRFNRPKGWRRVPDYRVIKPAPGDKKP